MLSFPRMNIRGPIEAYVGASLMPAVTMFPRMNIRGPIEALNERVQVGTLFLFPRMNIRGPIEAPAPWLPLSPLASGFRG